LKRRQNVRHHTVEIGVDVGIPEPEGLKALPFQNGVSDRVVSSLGIFGMTASIALDDKAAAETDEVEVVTAERRLPAEVKPRGA
jgi:hypothetical protein